MFSKEQDHNPVPRLCTLRKWSDYTGYGFNLHAEKSKPGQFIGKLDDESPSMYAGLQEFDRVIEVNGVNVCNENHGQVVTRVKENPNQVQLLVIDAEGEKYYHKRGMIISSDMENIVRIETPIIRPTNRGVVAPHNVAESSQPVQPRVSYHHDQPERAVNGSPNLARSSLPVITVARDSSPAPVARDSSTAPVAALSPELAPSVIVKPSTPPGVQRHSAGGVLDMNLSVAEMRARLGNTKRREVKERPDTFKDKASLFHQL